MLKPQKQQDLPPRTSKRERAERIPKILEELHQLYPEVSCALDHESPFQLLCATILSAQCTDERVNLVTPELFARYPDAHAMSKARVPSLERLIYSTGFYRNKAKNLKAMAQRLVEVHRGEVPQSMDDLLALAGVARKTANVVLGTSFGIAEGVVVDTHVGRISRRLGLTRAQSPVIVERELCAQLPKEDWIHWSHSLVRHGRAVCSSRSPDCASCTLGAYCPSKAMLLRERKELS